ncbi:FHA domain-containing protein [Thermodesulfobacteriota bacterium]
MKINTLKGRLEGHAFVINSDSLFIGRSPENDIQIPDPSVSRKHAKIYKSGDKYFIKDLKSSNGILVDGSMVDPGKEIEVQRGICFSVGDNIFSLDSLGSKKDQANQYSIDLTSVIERNGLSPFYRDREITNRRHLELIYEVSVALIQSLDLKTMCEKILDSLFHCLKRLDSGAILMIDENSGNIIQLMNKSRDPGSSHEINYSQTIVRQVIDEGRALMIENVDEYGGDLSDSIERMQIKAIMCVPLVCSSKTKGVIYVHSVNKPNDFRKEDFYMLVALSTTAALAIDNAIIHSGESLYRNRPEFNVILKNKMETIKSVARIISHKLNNLLMCLQGEISILMLDTQKKSKEYDRLMDMERYIQNGAALIGKLCGFQEEIYPDCCRDINMVVSRSVDTFIMPSKDMSVKKELSDDLWPVNIDELLIEKVLKNIFNFFTADCKSGTLSIRTENIKINKETQNETGLKNKRCVRISVNEKNIYMNKEDLLDCFNPGSKRAGDSEKTAETGLIDTYWIIEKHGGILDVSSDRNTGIRFNIYLPAEE